MKIYKIDFNENGYDQYDSFIVVANKPSEVVKYLKKNYNDYDEIDWEGGYKIKEIKIEKYKKVVELLGSYNAG